MRRFSKFIKTGKVRLALFSDRLEYPLFCEKSECPLSRPDRSGCQTLPSVVIVVLNWNNAVDTLSCLESLSKICYPNSSTIVVDNGSTDSSVMSIYSHYPDIKVLETGANLGYAEGNNFGIQHALNTDPGYLFVLNNDVCVAPDTLCHLISTAERFPNAAFLGPKVFHLQKPDYIQSAGGELDSLWRSRQRGLDTRDTGQFELLEEVDYVIGAAFLVRSDVLKDVGLLDPDFFLYREDVDWCMRARHLGYQILYVPQARVWHRSHHVRGNELPRITYYMTRNSLMLLAKHGGRKLRFALVLLRQLLTAVAWSVKPRWHHKRVERDALVMGIVDYFKGSVGRGYE